MQKEPLANGLILSVPPRSQRVARIHYTPINQPFCIAPKALWKDVQLLQDSDTTRFYPLEDALPMDSDRLCTIVPYVVYGNYDVNFHRLLPYWHSDLWWYEQRWDAMLLNNGKWILEKPHKLPLCCSQADPSKQYPQVSWNADKVNALWNTIPAITSINHPVWQKHLAREAKEREIRLHTRILPSFD
ncbi:MAG: hypothetical protein V4675_09905 [Verrucomicrobiota bacterium]